LAPFKPQTALPRLETSWTDAPGGEASDGVLMARFCQGDATAFNAIFQRYARPIQGYLTRLTGNRTAAEDLVQLTFLSLVRARGRFLPGARLKPWLYAIATNAARDQQRRNQRPEELTAQGELPLHAADDTAAVRDTGLERTVQRALEQLPEGQRIPIVMHRFEGMSFAEIAEALGLTETAVKVRAHRGYARLRELLARQRQEMKE